MSAVSTDERGRRYYAFYAFYAWWYVAPCASCMGVTHGCGAPLQCRRAGYYRVMSPSVMMNDNYVDWYMCKDQRYRVCNRFTMHVYDRHQYARILPRCILDLDLLFQSSRYSESAVRPKVSSSYRLSVPVCTCFYFVLNNSFGGYFSFVDIFLCRKTRFRYDE